MLDLERKTDLIEQLLCGFLAVAKIDLSFLSSHSNRCGLIFKLITIGSNQSLSSTSFELASLMLNSSDSIITHENFGDCVDLLISFSAVRESSDEQYHFIDNRKTQSLAIAMKSIEKLHNLYIIIPKLIESSGMQSERSWFEFWLPVLSGLSQQCYHTSKDVRFQSLTYLSRILLSEELKDAIEKNTTENFLVCFENVIFPFLEEFLKADDDKIDSQSMFEARLRAIQLVAKFYLFYLPSLDRTEQFESLWMQILDIFGKYLQFCTLRRHEMVVKKFITINVGRRHSRVAQKHAACYDC